MESSEQQLFTEWFTDMKGRKCRYIRATAWLQKDMIDITASENAAKPPQIKPAVSGDMK